MSEEAPLRPKRGRPERRVLALDIATTTGWACDGPTPGVPVSGTFKTPFAGGEEFGSGFVAFEAWLSDMMSVMRPEVLAFEAPVPRASAHGFQTTRILLGLATIAELVAAQNGVPCFETHIQSVRLHFTGSGRCDKRDVMHRCRVLGWAVVQLDASDACAVWDFTKVALRNEQQRRGEFMRRSFVGAQGFG